MTVALYGSGEEIPGLVTRSFLEAPTLHLSRMDYAARPKKRIRGIVLHTTQGRWPQVVWPAAGKPGGALANLHAWSHDSRCASSHLLVDRDGVVFCAADLATEQTWHATSVNGVTIGIEIVQGSDGSLYEQQIDSLVILVDWLTARFRIQRQVPDAFRGPIGRLESGGADVVGVYGHRDQSNNRGRGDPGDVVFDALSAVGYERFNLRAGDDLDAWRKRQRDLGFAGADVDGLPLDKTCTALERTGRPRGLWVSRPIDAMVST